MKEVHSTRAADLQMSSPPINGKQMESTANQTQPLVARSSNSGTSFKKSDNSHSSGCLGVPDANLEALNWQSAANAVAKPEHGQLTSAFTQNLQQLSAKQASQGSSKPSAAGKSNAKNSPQRRPVSRHQQPRESQHSTTTLNSSTGATGAASMRHTPVTTANSSARLGSTAVAPGKEATAACMLGPPANKESSGIDSKGGHGGVTSVASRDQAQKGGKQSDEGHRAVGKPSGKFQRSEKATQDSQLQTAMKKQRHGDSKVTGSSATTDASPRLQRQTRSDAARSMRTTRSKSKSIVHSHTDRRPSGGRADEASADSNHGENGVAIDGQSNGQSAHISFMDIEDDHVGKYEINQQVGLDLAASEHGEESKQARLEVGSFKRERLASGEQSLGLLRGKDAHNQSFQISESVDSLADNPLCTLIKQFQTQRINAQLTGKIKPTIQQFLDQFEKEMLFLEESYQTQCAARKEQMRLFEENYGMAAKSSRGPPGQPGQNTPAPQATSSKTPSFLQSGTPHLGQGAPSSDDIVADNKEGSVPVSFIQPEPTQSLIAGLNEESSLVSHHSSYAPPLSSSHAGIPMSDMSVSEVYESYSFLQNSLISFYPKDVRRCIQRRKTMNQTQLSADKLLASLKPPKHLNKARKISSKMHSLALCQVNMMQVLLQKISRKSKVIRKQEKIVNENLKRKRIYMEKEGFDIMGVLRQTALANEKGGKPGVQKRGASPATRGCLSTVGTQSLIGPTVNVIASTKIGAMMSDDISVDEKSQQLRKSGRLFSAQENTLSTTFAHEHGSQKISGGVGPALKINQKDNEAVIKTPEKPLRRTLQAEDQYLQAEQKVQQALNLSEIESTFLKASKNYSQKREDSNFSASQGTCRLGGNIASAGQDLGYPATLGPDYALINMMTPETAHAQVDVGLQESAQPVHILGGGLDSRVSQLQLTASLALEQSLIKGEDRHQLMRKNQSTQGKRVRRTAQNLTDQEDIVMDGQSNHLTFNERLNADGHGSFAIANLEHGTKVQLPDLLGVKSDAVHQLGTAGVSNDQVESTSTKNKKRVNSRRAAGPTKADKQNLANKKAQIKQADGRQQTGMQGIQQISAESHPHMVAATPHHQLSYSQSVHLQHPTGGPLGGLGAEHQSFYHGMPQMQELEEFGGQQQQGVITPNQMGLMGGPQQQMFDLSMHRSQSMMVPQPSYIATHCIDDMFFDESPAELSSMEPTAQSNQHMTNYSHVANPYEAAKRSFFATQQKNQQVAGSAGRHNSSAERVQLVKQQASDPASTYTVQESNSHSLPQAQTVRNQVHVQSAVGNPHQFISPMQIGQGSTPTPMNKLQENMTIVQGATTPSRFMGGVDTLPLPFMNQQAVVFNPQLLMSSGMKVDTGHSAQMQHHLQPHLPQGVDGSALSGAGSVFLRGANYTPAAMLAAAHTLTDSHRETLNVNAWHLDDNDTQTAHMVDTLIGNSAKTISEEQVRQHNSSSQQRSAEAEVDIFQHGSFSQNQYL